ncbi:NDP-sugar synthase [Thermodesulfobacteriota bacterium]
MKAIILAGGKGVRLRPYTFIFPKPLMPIDNYPILEIVIRQLKKSGFNDINLCVGHLANLIRAYFESVNNLGVKIRYSEEKAPLGTAGPLSLVEDLSDDFLVMNGDLLTDLDYKDLFANHLKSKSIATIAICKRVVPISLGIIKLNQSNNVVDYIEKPNLNHYVSMGIYVFNRDILNYIKHDEFLNLPDLIKNLISKKENINSYIFKGIWLDIGRVEDYSEAIEIFKKNQKQFIG